MIYKLIPAVGICTTQHTCCKVKSLLFYFKAEVVQLALPFDWLLDFLFSFLLFSVTVALTFVIIMRFFLLSLILLVSRLPLDLNLLLLLLLMLGLRSQERLVAYFVEKARVLSPLQVVLHEQFDLQSEELAEDGQVGRPEVHSRADNISRLDDALVCLALRFSATFVIFLVEHGLLGSEPDSHVRVACVPTLARHRKVEEGQLEREFTLVASNVQVHALRRVELRLALALGRLHGGLRSIYTQ